MARFRTGRQSGLVKSRDEIAVMREAGSLLAKVREALKTAVQEGVSTSDLDDLAREMILECGARPAFLGYRGYPATICASFDEEVVHGIPSPSKILQSGHIISIDVGLIHEGFYSDTAFTAPIGDISLDLLRLLDVTEKSLEIGIDAMEVDGYLGDISWAIQSYVESQGLTVVREYTGHGIGREMHEEPNIPNYGNPRQGLRLREGMVFALEPMVNLGGWRTRVLDDRWTVVTADGLPSAHFEHTIALTDRGAEVLTEE